MSTNADVLEFLRAAASYPEPTSRVDVIETHMAYVFLTDTLAYKLKKTVRYDFLDFSSTELRRQACQDELRLNRRLAPDVYLDVVPLVRTAAGQLRLGALAGAQPIDWLVKMRRLPEERMLDRVIRAGGPGAAELNALTRLLVDFYRAAPSEPMRAEAYADRLRRAVAADIRELLAYADHLPRARLAWLGAQVDEWLGDERDTLGERADRGRIVEAHGDLRPEHICLVSPPVIIDCLEFRRDFRLLDPLDELAFLLLECDRLGAPGVGRAVLADYVAQTGDEAPPGLVELYACCRALLRAKLALWHLRNGHGPADRWGASARDYIARAVRLTRSHGPAVSRAAGAGAHSATCPARRRG